MDAELEAERDGDEGFGSFWDVLNRNRMSQILKVVARLISFLSRITHRPVLGCGRGWNIIIRFLYLCTY